MSDVVEVNAPFSSVVRFLARRVPSSLCRSNVMPATGVSASPSPAVKVTSKPPRNASSDTVMRSVAAPQPYPESVAVALLDVVVTVPSTPIVTSTSAAVR